MKGLRLFLPQLCFLIQLPVLEGFPSIPKNYCKLTDTKLAFTYLFILSIEKILEVSNRHFRDRQDFPIYQNLPIPQLLILLLLNS